MTFFLRTILFVSLAVALVSSHVNAQSGPSLVSDIDPTISGQGSGPRSAVVAGNIIYFVARTTDNGQELWRSDGTSGGTALVADIAPGPGSSSPRDLTLVGNMLFFTAWTAATGQELWRSDGTAAGTMLVRDVYPGSTGSNISLLGTVGSTVFFAANHPDTGPELWRSDGTAAGTVVVRDIVPGTGGSNPFPLGVVGGTLFFSAYQPETGREFWRSNGTAAGTFLVKDLEPGPIGSAVRELAVAGGNVFLATGQPFPIGSAPALWRTDGTASGTLRIATFESSGWNWAIYYPLSLTPLGDGVCFVAYDSQHGLELWQSDGTPSGTKLLRDIATGIENGFLGLPRSSFPLGFTAFAGELYFAAYDYEKGKELWKTDGTWAGTRRVADIRPGQANSMAILFATSFGGALYFGAHDGEHGWELWKTNGTAAGTTMVVDLHPGPRNGFDAQARLLVELGGKLMFSGGDLLTGSELWNTDGTAAGTTLISDLDPARWNSSSVPAELTDLGGTLVFRARNDGDDDFELWRSDGTAAGTVRIKDIAPGPGPSYPRGFVPFADALFFIADDAVHGRELWRTDGTVAGTGLVKDINPAKEQGHGFPGTHSVISLPSVVGNSLFFGATTFASGQDLWKTDGTQEGTVRVYGAGKDGFHFDSRMPILDLNGMAIFSAFDDEHGVELWRSDGTMAGTVRVTDIHEGSGSSFPLGLIVVGSTAFFTAFDPSHGRELWRTDGTAQGTTLVKDIRPGPSSNSRTTEAVALGNTILFPALGPGGVELWRSDGTAAGTFLVKDIWPGGHARPAGFFRAGGLVYFTAEDGTHGRELWRTDGSASGTTLVKDIRAGAGSGTSPTRFAELAGNVYFAADDGVHGRELWMTDGTTAGTVLVSDIRPGADSGLSTSFTLGHPVVSDGRLFFVADDGVHGFELWKLVP